VDREANNNLWANDFPVGGERLLEQFHDARRRNTGNQPPSAGKQQPPHPVPSSNHVESEILEPASTGAMIS
jgi:hypothetical protein